MAVDLTPSPDVAALAERAAAFACEVVVPVEEEHRGMVTSEEVRAKLQRAARQAGVFAPHVSAGYGGRRLDMRGRAVVFAEAGYSLLGPLTLNIAVSDEGNMHLLEAVATEGQKERYLGSLAAGEVRSCFAMTEKMIADNEIDIAASRGLILQACWELDQKRRHNVGAAR